MQKIVILAVGKLKNPAIKELVAEYLKRLRAFADCTLLEVKAEPFGESDRQQAQKVEGERLLAALAKLKGYQVVWCDERGQEFTSVKFSQFIFGDSQPLCLVIGGAQGLLPEVFKEYPAAVKLSFSAMTWPHELARLMLLEQLYRAATISKGIAYHY
jgi:23S rRNA (pseudouridine1915-N3)-methyltransferase